MMAPAGFGYPLVLAVQARISDCWSDRAVAESCN